MAPRVPEAHQERGAGRLGLLNRGNGAFKSRVVHVVGVADDFPVRDLNDGHAIAFEGHIPVSRA